MKLVFAILSTEDAPLVNNYLTQDGFQVTKLATTVGFLKAGNTTFLIGTEEERVEEVLDILRRQSRRRIQKMPNPNNGNGILNPYPIEVSVGGATVFVVDVDRFEKL